MKKIALLLLLSSGLASAFPMLQVFVPPLPGLGAPGAPVPSGPPAVPQIDDPSAITNAYAQAAGKWAFALETGAAGLFSILALIDFGFYVAKLVLAKHTWDTGLLAMTNKLMSVGFFLMLLLNGTTWMPSIINLFIGIGRQGSGLPSITPSITFGKGVDIANILFWAGENSASHLDPLAALSIWSAALLVMAAFTLLTLHFLIAQVEIYYAIALGTVFLAMGGSKWTVPYVERYTAFCVQSGIKMMAFYFAIGSAQGVIDNWITEANKMGGVIGDALSGFVIAAGAFFLAMITWHVSKMVSGVLGGAPAMSGSDGLAFFMPIGGAAMAMSSITPAGAAARVAGGAAGAARGAASAAGGSGVASVPSPMLSAPNVAARAGQAASIAMNTLRSMPHSGGHSASPPSSGIGH